MHSYYQHAITVFPLPFRAFLVHFSGGNGNGEREGDASCVPREKLSRCSLARPLERAAGAALSAANVTDANAIYLT